MSPRPAPIVRETNVTADVAATLATEVVVATVAGISTDTPDERIDLHGFVQLVGGVGATAATLRIRRGVDATGLIIGEGNPVQTPASQTTTIDLDTQDIPGAVAGQAYTLTILAAGAAGTVQQAQIRAIQGAQ